MSPESNRFVTQIAESDTDAWRVAIPEERYVCADYIADGQPAVAVINVSLKGFAPREAFAWYLWVALEYEQIAENGMPTAEEDNLGYAFFERLDARLKGERAEHPNALFLARVTHDHSLQMMWYVHDPEQADAVLQQLISDKDYPREFSYEMVHDIEWTEAAYWLENV